VERKKDIGTREINAALKRAADHAARLNRALGLSHYEVRNGDLYLVGPDGSSRYVRPALFGVRKVKIKKIQIKP
jgi:hypothetical protein